MLETISDAMLWSRRKFCPSLFEARCELLNPTISYCPCEETVLRFAAQLFENAFRYDLLDICQACSVLDLLVTSERFLLPRINYGPHRLLSDPGQLLQRVHSRGYRLRIVEEIDKAFILFLNEPVDERDDFGLRVGS